MWFLYADAFPSAWIDANVNSIATQETCDAGEKCVACMILEGIVAGICG